ncbi:uncharacterized protein LOC108916481 isoform X3 [Anoplophora glabripennis]|uniref:uncharacterized protein LOC108916481 isoform X3 n=1 Tax=Anoplophora glabripennis TaxID=217634 RepID=UPI000873FDFD|nr:uncharacterized protein LOC108916481 isoform X3 [Anoplophora glabripennis]
MQQQESETVVYCETVDDVEQTLVYCETVEELLISLVQLRPALWDHRIPLKSRSKNIKDDLWVEVYTAMGQIIPLEEIKKKWRNLRDKYIKVKGEICVYKPSGMGAKGKQKVWKHFSALQFLDDSINPRRTIGSIKMPQDITPNSESDSRPSSSASLANETPTVGRTKRKITGELINNKILEVLNVPPPSVNINPSSVYEGNAACVAIAEILNKLPERNKAKLEIELLRLVYDTYDQYISDSGCSN